MVRARNRSNNAEGKVDRQGIIVRRASDGCAATWSLRAQLPFDHPRTEEIEHVHAIVERMAVTLWDDLDAMEEAAEVQR